MEEIMKNLVYSTVIELVNRIEKSQEVNIKNVATEMVSTIEKNGLIQAFGSGHSYGSALELTHRAGGFIPSKNIKEPALGSYENIEGVGTTFMKKVDVRKDDIVFIISNSGRNPLPIEVALACKAKGAKTVAVTSLLSSKSLKSKHSSNKNLFEVCDYVLDNCVVEGDATIEIANLNTKVCGMSSIATNTLLQAVVFKCTELLIEKGITPPIYMSQNIDGGREFNETLEEKYVDRLQRL